MICIFGRFDEKGSWKNNMKPTMWSQHGPRVKILFKHFYGFSKTNKHFFWVISTPKNRYSKLVTSNTKNQTLMQLSITYSLNWRQQMIRKPLRQISVTILIPMIIATIEIDKTAKFVNISCKNNNNNNQVTFNISKFDFNANLAFESLFVFFFFC